jgi:hypothetical protein
MRPVGPAPRMRTSGWEEEEDEDIVEVFLCQTKLERDYLPCTEKENLIPLQLADADIGEMKARLPHSALDIRRHETRASCFLRAQRRTSSG